MDPDPNQKEERAKTDLLSAVYGELRKLAASRMAREYGPQTLQATALVHEAWIRMGGDDQPNWANKAQFFSAAAEAMRRIMVERARKRQALRHGGGQKRVEFDALNWENLDLTSVEGNDREVVGLHEALEKLAIGDPETAELVKLRYFAGLSVKESAQATGLSERTAERRIAYARAWLGREMERDSK